MSVVLLPLEWQLLWDIPVDTSFTFNKPNMPGENNTQHILYLRHTNNLTLQEVPLLEFKSKERGNKLTQ